MTVNDAAIAGAAQALIDRMEIEVDEEIVASLVARRTEEGTWLLQFGSVLAGPSGMCRSSWLEWRDEQSGSMNPATKLLVLWGHPAQQWQTFDEVVGSWRLLRFSMCAENLSAWLAAVLAAGHVGVPDAWDPINASAQPADAWLRLFAHQDNPTSRLASMVGRPVLGWAHPLAPPPGTGPTEAPPQEWALEPGQHPFPGLLFLAGISVSELSDVRVAQSLLIGHIERRAWIEEVRGAQPDLSTFDVRVQLDPTRVALWDLAIDLEESDRSGHILNARRLRLADVAIPNHGAADVTVRLPTLGSQVVRRVRLYDRDGRLLDVADNVVLLEQIHLQVSTGAGSATTASIGSPRPATLMTRLAALDRCEEGYRQLLEAGVTNRVVLPNAAGAQALRSQLAAARVELLIFDPYFGADTSNWAVLDDVQVPIKCLIGKDAQTIAGIAPLAPNIEVRHWSLTKPRTPEFHDRAYLWQGGGLVVGTSPNGLGGRLAMIDALDGATSVFLTRQFQIWWSDPRFTPVEVPKSAP